MDNKGLKIVSLNTAGAKGNSVYISEIIKNNDIVFICEHWLNKFEKYLIKNLCENNEKVFFFSPIENINNIGRPWGGLCWIIKNNVEIIDVELN